MEIEYEGGVTFQRKFDSRANVLISVKRLMFAQFKTLLVVRTPLWDEHIAYKIAAAEGTVPCMTVGLLISANCDSTGLPDNTKCQII